MALFPHRRSKVERAFCDVVARDCEAAGIAVSTAPRVTALECSGEFSGSMLWVDTSLSEWFEVLIHEYCHFLQWKDGARWFADGASEWWHTYDRALRMPRTVSSAELAECTHQIQACELDAERRTVRLLERYRFPSVDLDLYVRAANAYVYAYEAAAKLRRWIDKRAPQRISKILRMMPKRIIRTADARRLPVGYLDLFARHCVL